MSQKEAKALRKEQKEKQEDFELRREAMLKEVKRLGEKYRIDIQGALRYTPQSIIPMVAFVDVKDQYEKIARDKTNGELKPKLKV